MNRRTGLDIVIGGLAWWWNESPLSVILTFTLLIAVFVLAGMALRYGLSRIL